MIIPLKALGIAYLTAYLPTEQTESYNNVYFNVNPSDECDTIFSLSYNEMPKSQIEADENYFGPNFQKWFVNMDHKQPTPSLTPYFRMMIKSNSNHGISVKLTSK